MYLLGELGAGHKLQGPCLLIDSNRWAEGRGHGCRGWGDPWGPGCRSLKGSRVPSWLGCFWAWARGVPAWEEYVAWLLQPLCCPARSTILVEPACQAEVTETGDIRISVGAEAPGTVGAQLDPIHLSIFSHRFMSIAGEWLPPSCSPAPLPAVHQAGVCGEKA